MNTGKNGLGAIVETTGFPMAQTTTEYKDVKDVTIRGVKYIDIGDAQIKNACAIIAVASNQRSFVTVARSLVTVASNQRSLLKPRFVFISRQVRTDSEDGT